MVTARRTLAGIAILGLAIALVIIQQRRGDAPAVDAVDGASPPIDDAGAIEQAAPAAAPATDRTPASASITEDEAIGICAQIIDDATAFAEMERNAASLLDAKPSNDQISAERENLPRSLAGSPDPELFVTAFLLDRPERRMSDDASAYARLVEFGRHAADSGSPFLAWHALRACVEAEEYCPYPHLEQSLLEADRDNAEAWAMVATLRYRRGDGVGALSAIQDAAHASTSTVYLTETMAMTERSLAEHTAMPYMDRLSLAIAAGTSAFPATLNRICSNESAASRAWAEACLAFGTLQGEHNETDFGHLIAYRIREQALTALGDIEGAAEVAEEAALYRVERSAGLAGLFGTINSLAWVLVSTDPERLQTYLDAVRELGEVEGSRRFLRRELPPLLDRAGLLDQEGTRECVAQFLEPPAAVGTLSATFRDYPVEQYPIQVGDQLQIAVLGAEALANSLQVGLDGTITLRRVAGGALDDAVIAAVGKTTGQIEREIATLVSERQPSSSPSPEVFVILVSPRSVEDLQLEFDEALREAAESREEPR